MTLAMWWPVQPRWFAAAMDYALGRRIGKRLVISSAFAKKLNIGWRINIELERIPAHLAQLYPRISSKH